MKIKRTVPENGDAECTPGRLFRMTPCRAQRATGGTLHGSHLRATENVSSEASDDAKEGEYTKEAEDLREDAARLRAILDTTVDGIVTINESNIIQSFNKAAEHIFGYSASEVIGKNVKMLMPSPYRENHDSYVADYLRTGERKIIGTGREVRGLRKDGSTFPLYLAVSEVRVGHKRLFTGILRDISDQEKAAESLKQSEQKYRALVESSSDAILLMDEDRRIISYNRAFLGLFGFRWQDVEGKSARILHRSDESFTSFAEMNFPVIESEGSVRTEWELVRKDGTLFPIEETIAAIKNPDGSTKGFVAVIRDMTERKRSEDELEKHRNHLEELIAERTRELENAHRALMQKEKIKTLGAISAEVAHEIRNPLMAIGGFARRLQKKFPQAREVGIILAEARRLEDILNRIRDYLKPVEMRPQECAVNDIIEECFDLLSLELNQQGIVSKLVLAPELTPAYVDPGILRQVLANVIRNSIKVIDKRGKLVIETFETAQNIHINIRAPIPGLKVKDAEVFFLPFGDAGQSISVPLCFRLLRDMGGDLSFKQDEDSVIFATSLLKAIGTKLKVNEV